MIRLDDFNFAPKALERRGKLWERCSRPCPEPTAAGPTSSSFQSRSPHCWAGARAASNTCSLTPRDPGDELTPKSYRVVVEVSYVLDPAVVNAIGAGRSRWITSPSARLCRDHRVAKTR